MRDAFAVLFFVSVGMLFDPKDVATGWPLMLATFGIVVIGKPLAALLVVLVLKKPLATAVSVSVALAQIGEFSFILAALGRDLHILPEEATGALVVASIASITVNPLLYRAIAPTLRWIDRKWPAKPSTANLSSESLASPSHHSGPRVVIVGYGPVGRTLSRLLRANAIEVAVIDMNLETVRELRAQGEPAIYGDAAQREILHQAGLETARGLILAASGLPAQPIVEAARELNSHLRILTRTEYLRDAETLRRSGAQSVFTSEGEIALAMTAWLMRELGSTDEQIDRERDRVRAELFAPSTS
jgi:CPA2 family monovalent cation:H+ antiporter-2